MRAVVDTNILVRALIKPTGTVGSVLHLLRKGAYTYLYSNSLLEELTDVIGRSHIRRKYSLDEKDVEVLISFLLMRGEAVEPSEQIRECRDPKDNKFLEVAVSGKADMIVTSDEDLLVLSPFRGIIIQKPSYFLNLLDKSKTAQNSNE